MTATAHNARLLLLALIGIAPFMVNGLINSKIAHNALLYWGFELLTWIVIPCSVLYFVMRTPGMRFADLGYHGVIFGRRNTGLLLLVCVLFAPVDFGLYWSMFKIFNNLFPGSGYFSYESIVPESGIFYYLVVVYFALSAGFVEEFLFRGLLYRGFAGFRHSLALFLVISPLLFSLVHWESGVANLFATWVVGLFMAVVYHYFRNLWPLIVGHVFTDLVWFG